ncbi:GntR family transcriptional regulator [Corynebacterium accolens]|nr:GntR family transcriptional regulator [Corynebacterium accolens]MDK4246407.1 GntR family transcriptional regulator [Corynebacterium accolens]
MLGCTTYTVFMPLRLDPADTRALPVQIADAVRADATSGALLPGEAVPSTRALATQLGVSRGSVVTAYEQLTVGRNDLGATLALRLSLAR